MFTALITANVFQNALANRDAYWRLYAERLRMLASQPVTWYMTSFDYALASAFWNIFCLGGDIPCQEAYLGMMQRIKQVCPIDEDILAGADRYQINYADALRVACARDRFLDYIVTWDAHQFARNESEHNQVKSNGYFYFPIHPEDGETGKRSNIEVGIFSPSAFLLHFQQDDLRTQRFVRCRRSQSFCLDDFSLQTTGKHNEATVTLRNLMGHRFQGNATGNSPVDALQRAVDQAVEQCVVLPTHYLSRWFVPLATLFGADAPVEVVVGVECDGFIYEAGVSHSNVFQAAAEAYIQIINQICSDLHFPDAS